MTQRYDFDAPINRIHTDSYKWDMEGEGGKKIPLGVADSDFRAPEEVRNAVKKKAEFGVYAYGALPQERFAEAVSGWYRKRYGIEVLPEIVCHAQGIMPGALWMLLLALTEKGDCVIIQEPVYHNFRTITENMGRKAVSSDLKLVDGRYGIDWADLEEKMSRSETKVFLLCSPHNPVGRVWCREELEHMVRLCTENDVFIIADEVHGDIVYEPYRHVPVISVSEEAANRSVIMSAPSKTFNLAGFYSSYVLIKNEEVRRKYQLVYEKFHFDYNFIGMEALITAYNECDYFVDEQNKYLYKNIQIVKKFVEDYMPEIRMTEPEASYLLWLDCRAWNLRQEELMGLFGEWGVKLNDGSMYGESGNGFVRLNVATQANVLEEALERIRCGYEKWKCGRV